MATASEMPVLLASRVYGIREFVLREVSACGLKIFQDVQTPPSMVINSLFAVALLVHGSFFHVTAV